MKKNPIKPLMFLPPSPANSGKRKGCFMKTKTPLITNSMNRSRLRCGLFLISLVLAAFALSPTAQAQLSPPPDGGYPGNNTAEGTDALFSVTTGTDNTAIGFEALYSNTTGDSNTATGSAALMSNTTGIRNTANGFAALQSNTTGERNTATGRAALASNTTGSHNTANGQNALFANSTGIQNTATGSFALVFNSTGNQNTANGYAAMLFNTIGNQNTGTGYFAVYQNTTGNNNTGYGYSALLNNTTGGGNIALGNFAGSNLTTGDNNIDIGNLGVVGEADTIRIGTQGTQTKTFIAGITGAGVTGVAVKINAAGQLGTAPSSARFKQNIRLMDKASEAILALKPVTFRYKNELDPDGAPQFGLIAEEVEKVNPDLVARDFEGKVYTVRYEAVNAMLLNEFLKQHRTVQELKSTVTKQEATIAQQQKDFQSTAAQQQREIKALTASLKEQASQIQKVSARLEFRKSAPQTVLNDQ
jgi:Chaperone of endosialidase